jgi:N-acetylmuramoyl-L-alanine amidase
VRLWRAPDNTRLVFDLSGPVQHSVFTLTAPDRLVIDINGATLGAPLNVATSNTPITSMRSAQRTPTDLRVVIDLKKPVAQELHPGAECPVRQPPGGRPVRPGSRRHRRQQPAAPAVQPRDHAGGAGHPVQPAIKLPPAPAGKRDIVVAIDAGHGGEDPGASGSRGQHEKDMLDIAKELQRQINSERFRAELTRTGDYFIPLRKRTEIARKKGADLFVSIHADAAPSKAAFGASVFALSDRGATSETARWLADSENRSDLIGGAGNVSLDDKDRMLAGVLLDLSMTATLTSSLNVGQRATWAGDPLHKQRVEQAGFMVLKSPDIPSILVETGFISNANEAANWPAQPPAGAGPFDQHRRAPVLPAEPATGHLHRLAA